MRAKVLGVTLPNHSLQSDAANSSVGFWTEGTLHTLIHTFPLETKLQHLGLN
jgi:hypothetical protein